ncbi:hypothetical protein V3C99_010576 [Haemonchus contortus]
MTRRLWVVLACLVYAAECDILEMTGFHCKNANSMRLDRSLHGAPHMTIPPFEFSISDEEGNAVEYYEPGEIYRVRLVGYIHFRGFMLQSRLCSPEGYLIGSLRGGRFIVGDGEEVFGVRYQYCDDSMANDSVTHSDNRKKFLVELLWTTDRDIGAVQFLLTVAAEDELYWERWRPRAGFIRPKWAKDITIVDSLFKIEVSPGPEEPTLSPEEEASTLSSEELGTVEPFDPKIFEEIEAAEEHAMSQMKSGESLVALNSAVTPISIPMIASTWSASTSTLQEQASAIPETTIIEVSTTEWVIENTTATQTTTDEFSESISTDPTAISRLQILTSTMPESDEANITEVTRRLFKKYSPSENDHLRDDDLRFLNSHTQLLQHDFVDTDMDPEETCRQANPCENHGTCTVKENRVHCECAKGFTGVNCTEPDMCISHFCANNSTCKNGPNKTYKCECQENTVGTYCQFICEPNQCSGNGTCIMRIDGKVGCKCNPGMTGPKCDKEIDECRQAKCLNSLKCIDKFNDYECVCMDGWNGKNCDRPCQDIYGSCKMWKREGQCEIPPEETVFFWLNCPESCEKCVPRNDTIRTLNRLPAILVPLAWTLGEWHSKVEGFNHRSFDYPTDFSAVGYDEILTFSVAKPVMFGTPSINVTSRAVSRDDPSDVHLLNGFLTIRQYPPPGDNTIRVALSSVNNQGLTLVEEGPLSYTENTSGPILNLAPIDVKIFEGLDQISLKRWTRSFVRKGAKMIQSVSKEVNGRKIKFKKIYERVREFDFL